ncbi:hypothetical protein RRG08_043627 [Elysia crispata]|uniref:Uncharacterized protein n=1 Tax=Elysia crispata TaxID=231223 RepID=A0AAE1A624_9GAST|nr:hypothetical protein RRG08_043627 [Elysia crispata]
MRVDKHCAGRTWTFDHRPDRSGPARPRCTDNDFRVDLHRRRARQSDPTRRFFAGLHNHTGHGTGRSDNTLHRLNL